VTTSIDIFHANKLVHLSDEPHDDWLHPNSLQVSPETDGINVLAVSIGVGNTTLDNYSIVLNPAFFRSLPPHSRDKFHCIKETRHHYVNLHVETINKICVSRATCGCLHTRFRLLSRIYY
jgi:hypothetical protein